MHDRLDAGTDAAALGDDARYAEFLTAQYRARKPIEVWASRHLDENSTPPPIADLLADDLRELGVAIPPFRAFQLPPSAAPLGVAWAIGGSSLGNKAMLAERRRSGARHAERFLSDTRGMDFFRSLLPRLTASVSETEAAGAIGAAEAVFATFLSAVATPRRAAA
jgi:heme oxygenase